MLLVLTPKLQSITELGTKKEERTVQPEAQRPFALADTPATEFELYLQLTLTPTNSLRDSRSLIFKANPNRAQYDAYVDRERACVLTDYFKYSLSGYYKIIFI